MGNPIASDMEAQKLILKLPSIISATIEEEEEKLKKEKRTALLIVILIFSVCFVFILMWTVKIENNIKEADIINFKRNFQKAIYEAELEEEMAKINETTKEARIRFTQKSTDQKLLDSKWAPNPTKFQGVEQFLQATGTHGNQEEDLLYFSIPVFLKTPENDINLEWNYENINLDWWTTGRSESSKQLSEMINRFDTITSFTIGNDATLMINQTFTLENGQKFKITRHYYVPARYLN